MEITEAQIGPIIDLPCSRIIARADNRALDDAMVEEIARLREDDPQAYGGMDCGQAIAALASTAGNKVSKATVYRSINEAHAEDGTNEYAGMTKQQRKTVSRMRAGKRKEAARILKTKGPEALDSWLCEAHAQESSDEVAINLRRIFSAAAEIRRLERDGAKIGQIPKAIVESIENLKGA